MTEETPKRDRGAREREIGYRQGFIDGYAEGVGEARRLRDEDQRRETLIQEGIAKIRAGVTPIVHKRRQSKKRGDDANAPVDAGDPTP